MSLGLSATTALIAWLSVAPPIEAPPPKPETASKTSLQVERDPGQGVRLSTADGRFSMQTWMRAQFRDSFVHDPNASPSLHHTLEARRASVYLAGHVFGPHNKVFMQLAFAPRDLGLQTGHVTQSPIADLFVTFDYLRDLSIRIGQYKPFFSRQFIASWGNLQFVDRSIVQNEFHLDRDIGFDLFSNDLGGLDLLRYSVGVYSGQGRNNLTRRDFRMTYLARFEVLPFGGFNEYSEADLERRPTPKLALGAAYAYSDHARAERGVIGAKPADGGTTNFHHVVADAIFKIRGFSAQAEFFWRQGTRNPGSAVDAIGVAIPVSAARNGLGWFAQAGYLLPRAPVEFVVRGGQIFGLGETSLTDANEVGGGPNWYFRNHTMKLQADYFHTWIGSDIQHGSDQFRLQLQVSL